MVQCEECGYGDGVHMDDCVLKPSNRIETHAFRGTERVPGYCKRCGKAPFMHKERN
jgi:hypothetical protein